MNKNIIPSILVLTAFVSPFAVVSTVDRLRQESAALQKSEMELSAKKEADDARAEYYSSVNERKENLKDVMNDAKQQYDQLVKDQPQAIKDNQQTVSQTTVEPVMTKETVTVPVSQPKTSTKTKTS